MANKDAAFGLKPVRMMGGAPYSGGQSRYRIASGASNSYISRRFGHSAYCWCTR